MSLISHRRSPTRPPNNPKQSERKRAMKKRDGASKRSSWEIVAGPALCVTAAALSSPTTRPSQSRNQKRGRGRLSACEQSTLHSRPPYPHWIGVVGMGPLGSPAQPPAVPPFHHTGCLGNDGGHLTCYRLWMSNTLSPHSFSHRQSKMYDFYGKLACSLSGWRRLTSLRHFYWKELSPTATTTKAHGGDGVVKYSYQPAGQNRANVSDNCQQSSLIAAVSRFGKSARSP